MAKLRWSTEAWSSTLKLLLVTKQLNGLNGCHLQSFGSILTPILALRCHHLKLCKASFLQSCRATFLAQLDALDYILSQREKVLFILKGHLHVAQERMKSQANKHRQARSFVVGDWVYLRLQPYRQKTLAYKGKWKLSPRYFGPFKVIQKVRFVSYRLDLPPESKIHLIFHVSCLKLKLGQHVTPLSTLPLVDDEGQVAIESIAVLQTRTKTLRTRDVTEVLV